MKIELKNIKVSPSLSEETLAYTATIYVDGAKAFHASNHGHGASDMFHTLPGYTGPNERTVSDWIARNEPPTGPYEADPAKRSLWDTGGACTLEAHISRILERRETDRAMSRHLKNVCAIDPSGAFVSWKVLATPATLAAMRKAKEPAGYVIVNDGDEAMMSRARVAFTGGTCADELADLERRDREGAMTGADAAWLLIREAGKAGDARESALMAIVARDLAKDAQHRANVDAAHAARTPA